MQYICVIFVVFCAARTSAYETDDGAIVDKVVENLRTFIRLNNLETGQLPNFDWFPGKYWSIRGTEGSFGDLSTVQWADRAAVIPNGDVTNIQTSLYLPEALIHYKITIFQVLDITADVKVITNALKLDLDFNQTDCTVAYNQIEVYYFENIFPKIHVGILDNHLVPREIADTVQTWIAVGVKMTNYVLNIIVRPVITSHVSQVLSAESPKIDLCQVFQLKKEFIT